MRIRNRKGLLVSSSSSSHLRAVSETSSDPQPQLNQPKTTPHELHPIPTNHFQVKPQTHSKPSDDSSHQPPFLLPCLRPSNIHNNHTHTSGINQKVGDQVKLEDKASRQEQVETGAGTRKQNIVFVDAPVTESVALTHLSSCHVNESWFDADKKIPPGKKRKGLALEKMSPETAMFEKAKKMKPKINNKCSATGLQQVHVEQDKAGNDDSNSTNHDMNVDKKINKRGGEIKEGSRCSRVNGRGWRCGQQTLMGYSLCEHHLGKGRLRSIANIRGRAKMLIAAAPTTEPHSDATDNITNDDQPAKKVLVSSSLMQPDQDNNKETILLNGSCYDDNEGKEEDGEDKDCSDEEMKKQLLTKKKRMKLGTVKARSLSSLLNQTNNAGVVAAEDK